MGMGGIQETQMRTTPALVRMSTNVMMTLSTGLLELIDCILVTFQAFRAVASIALSFLLRRSSTTPKPSVVIVGASFAGLWAQRALCADSTDPTRPLCSC